MDNNDTNKRIVEQMASGEALKAALHYGTSNPIHAREAGITILDDQSEREYNQEWTIAIVFERDNERYGFYRDGNETIMDILDDEKTVAEWASRWDREHLPELLAKLLT